MTLHDRLISALKAHGVTTMFGLPGGGPNLDVVGAAVDSGLRFVLAHGETEAAIMASSFGLISGTPAPVVATRGPGATSLVNGVAQATLDRFPLVAITDTVPSAHASRVEHQRIDQRAVLGPVSKLSRRITDRTGEADLAGAIGWATTWPFGAVHLDYDPDALPDPVLPPVADPTPTRDQLDAQIGSAIETLSSAKHPIVIVGAEAAAAADELKPILANLRAPVLCTYQAVGLVDTEGPQFGGLFTNGALEREAIGGSDAIVAVGLDLVEPIPAPWNYPQPLIRLSSVPQRSAYYEPTHDIVAPLSVSSPAVLSALASRTGSEIYDLRERARQRIRACEAETDGLGVVALTDAVAAHMPRASITVDAGAHFLAVMPLVPVADPHQLLISNGLATMGFAVPAAIGVSLARPGEPVVALTGDGGLSMVLGELETIARLELPITVVVFNDAALSLIEIKQSAGHGGSEAVRYRPVDFAAVASASGLDGIVVESERELAAALSGSWEQPRLVDARIDPSAYPALISVSRG